MCRKSQVITQVVFQAKTQAKIVSIELPPCSHASHSQTMEEVERATRMQMLNGADTSKVRSSVLFTLQLVLGRFM